MYTWTVSRYYLWRGLLFRMGRMWAKRKSSAASLSTPQRGRI